ncbi:MAG: TRAP transporter small permease [Acidiferrobacterales bacterium]
MESAIAIAGLVLLLLLSLAEIAARNFFHSAIPGADILDRYLVLWVSLLGAVVTQHHIKVDVASIWLSEAWRHRLNVPILIFSALICSGLAFAGARFWWVEWQDAPQYEKWTSALNIIIPLTFSLLAVHFILRCFIRPQSPEDAQ